MKHISDYTERLLAAFVLLLLLGLQSAVAQTPVYDYEVVNTYPHRSNAFTQGLQFEDGFLYEGTGLHGGSTLARIDLESGEVLQMRRLDSAYFGEGIAIVDQRIYQLTWRSNMVFVYDRETFDVITTHYHPGEGWGLAWDGQQLILSDGSAELQFIEPETFRVQRRVQVLRDGQPVPYLNELAYIDGEVWANVWMSEEIMRIDPQTGQVLAVVDLGGLRERTRISGNRNEAVLNGIAWDAEAERLLVTGKLWSDIFEIRLLPR